MMTGTIGQYGKISEYEKDEIWHVTLTDLYYFSKQTG